MLDGGRVALAPGTRAASLAARLPAVASRPTSCAGRGWRMSPRCCSGSACSGRSGRSRASCSTARSPRAPARLPAGHARGQPLGAFVLGAARRGGARRRRAAAGGHRDCSAPTRRSARGCSRPTGWPRTARAARAREPARSLVLGLAVAWLGRELGGCCDPRRAEADRCTSASATGPAAGSSPTCSSTSSPPRAAREPGAARRERLRGQAPAADGPPAHALGGPAARGGRRRRPASGSTPSCPTSARPAGDGLVTLERARLSRAGRRPGEEAKLTV